MIRRYTKIKRSPIGRRTKSPYKFAMDAAWQVCSFYIRLRAKKRTGGFCELCLRMPIEHAFHFISRSNLATKFEIDNLCGSCAGCNFRERQARGNAGVDAMWRAHHVRLIGEAAVARLEAMALTQVKLSAGDLLEIRDKFKALLAQPIEVK